MRKSSEMLQDNGRDFVLETLIETAKEMNVDLSEDFIRSSYELFAGYQFSESELKNVTDKLRDLLQKEITDEIEQ
jgi:propanediol dehydratase small subunit